MLASGDDGQRNRHGRDDDEQRRQPELRPAELRADERNETHACTGRFAGWLTACRRPFAARLAMARGRVLRFVGVSVQMLVDHLPHGLGERHFRMAPVPLAIFVFETA